MNLTTLGIDLAKTSFSLVGMDERGKVVLRKKLKRELMTTRSDRGNESLFIAKIDENRLTNEAVSTRIFILVQQHNKLPETECRGAVRI